MNIELDDGELEYIHFAEIDGIKHFTLAKISIFGYMTDSSIFEYMTNPSISADDFCAPEFIAPEFIEDYGSVEDAKRSELCGYYMVD